MNDTALKASPTRNDLVSVVIPVYNEELVLPALFDRLYPALDALQRPYELIFINDGSRDDTVAMTVRHVARDPRLPERLSFGPIVDGRAVWVSRHDCRYSRTFRD